MHCAAISGSITKELLHCLLQVVGVEINAEDVSGKTALQHAAEIVSKKSYPYGTTTWLLLKSGASQATSRAIVG